jgi:hypothetical protein
VRFVVLCCVVWCDAPCLFIPCAAELSADSIALLGQYGDDPKRDTLESLCTTMNEFRSQWLAAVDSLNKQAEAKEKAAKQRAAKAAGGGGGGGGAGGKKRPAGAAGGGPGGMPGMGAMMGELGGALAARGGTAK